jgi:hypothetical protein
MTKFDKEMYKALMEDAAKLESFYCVTPGAEVVLGTSIIFMDENGVREIKPEDFYKEASE